MALQATSQQARKAKRRTQLKLSMRAGGSPPYRCFLESRGRRPLAPMSAILMYDAFAARLTARLPSCRIPLPRR